MLEHLTRQILMVRPANFGFNIETASNNAFQIKDLSLNSKEIAANAIVEFDGYVSKLRAVGIEVMVIQDSEKPIKPDAVFPNNWVSFHASKTMITYPMFSPKRQLERSAEVLKVIKNEFCVEREVNYESFENESIFLEGTGSMIFDREYKIAYACESVRTDKELFYKFCEENNFDPVLFQAQDKNGVPVYHTNVIMCVAHDFVVICMEAIKSKEEQEVLLEKFKKTGKEVLDISFDQVLQFAGNMIQLKNKDEEKYLVMSSCAYHSLTKQQLDFLSQKTKIVHAPLPTIEKYGGGSARCMIAEVFLNKK